MGNSLPQGLCVARHLDLHGRAAGPWVRRGLLLALSALLLAALLGTFGQQPAASTSAGPAAVLTVSAPTRARGGLLYTASFRVVARRDLAAASLRLDPGWIDGMQVNSTNPQPRSESSLDGRIVLELGRIGRGHSSLTFIEFQVDPTTVGRRAQDVSLFDGDERLAEVRRTLIVFP